MVRMIIRRGPLLTAFPVFILSFLRTAITVASTAFLARTMGGEGADEEVHGEDQRDEAEVQRQTEAIRGGDTQHTGDGWVLKDEVGSGPREHDGGGIEQPREVVHQAGNDGTGDEEQDHACGEAADQQGNIAGGERPDGEDIVEAHGEVGDHDGRDGGQQPVGGAIGAAVLALRKQDADGDEKEDDAAYRLKIADGEQFGGNDGKDDAHHDGARAAPEDGEEPLPARKLPRGSADDERVVATEDDINEGNATGSGEER